MPFLFTLLTIALMVFALVDIIRREDAQVRYMPKFVWLLLVILLPLIGSILWFAIGREYPDGGIRLGGPARAPRAVTAAPPAPPAAPPAPADTRTTEEQIADLEREIEEWRLREEIAKRKKERGEEQDG
ncbi:MULTISPECIES: PLDc N-terminal domain-containing protein [Microbacterium]|uniref:PLDc N-terminal domain-containing protein n=1 Tax=Microbacterium TaxID=33882 RepID=UPI00217CDB31|nr:MULTISPECIES: PLDc N-terminal domain-containing protein [Microbacterium]UWF76969.1 PLDc N-terminal domain-containing protein [Microbacterium neungamense]WCM55129.1 PLDc N-terminal domain-containing protein [Microbacterium sp. EF45047]